MSGGIFQTESFKAGAGNMVRHCREFNSVQRTLLALALLTILSSASAKPKGKPKEAQPADPAADVQLPENVNSASLRVSAIDTIYELDLSIAQLNSLRDLAASTGETTVRSPAVATTQFVSTLKDFQTALLEGKDDQQIAKLRNQVIDMVDGADVHLDNDIVTTAKARAKAASACAQLKASQIAAYLAIHAEEVSDPQELMMSTVDGLQEMHADSSEKNAEKTADKSGDSAADAGNTIQEASLTVGYLIAGMDDAKAHAITQQVADWLRASDKLSDTEFAARRQALEDSSRKIVGEITPIQVLDNWMQDQMATLLSNPQLSQAIEVVLKCREQGN